MSCKNPVFAEDITLGFSSSVQTYLNPNKTNAEKTLISHSFLETRQKIPWRLSWVFPERFKEHNSFIFSCDTYCPHLPYKYVGIQRLMSPGSLTRNWHGPIIQFYLIWVNAAWAGKLVHQQMMAALIHGVDFALRLQEDW